MNLWPFRRRAPAAIALPDRSISASDASRILREHGAEARRAVVRAKCREICAARGLPVPPALER